MKSFERPLADVPAQEIFQSDERKAPRLAANDREYGSDDQESPSDYDNERKKIAQQSKALRGAESVTTRPEVYRIQYLLKQYKDVVDIYDDLLELADNHNPADKDNFSDYEEAMIAQILADFTQLTPLIQIRDIEEERKIIKKLISQRKTDTIFETRQRYAEQVAKTEEKLAQMNQHYAEIDATSKQFRRPQDGAVTVAANPIDLPDGGASNNPERLTTSI